MINKGALKFFYFINLDFVELCLFIEFDTIHLNDGTSTIIVYFLDIFSISIVKNKISVKLLYHPVTCPW